MGFLQKWFYKEENAAYLTKPLCQTNPDKDVGSVNMCVNTED